MLQENNENRPAEQMVNFLGNFPKIEVQDFEMQYIGYQLLGCWIAKSNRPHNCSCCGRGSQADVIDKALEHVVKQIDVEKCMQQNHEHQRSQDCNPDGYAKAAQSPRLQVDFQSDRHYKWDQSDDSTSQKMAPKCIHIKADCSPRYTLDNA